MKHFACIYNAAAGSAHSAADITSAFKTAGGQVSCFAIQMERDELLDKIKKKKVEAVVAAGGDGTVNAVASLALELKLPLGILPVGTLNHFSKDCSVPQDFEEAVRTICTGQPRAVDYCRVNGKLFLNNASIGIYPSTVLARERRNYTSKVLATATAFMAALFKDHIIRAELTNGNFRTTVHSSLIFVGNNHYDLEKVGFTNRSDVTSGELFLYVVKARRITALLLLALLSLFGMRRRSRDVMRDTTDPITITSPKKSTAIALDGEVVHLSFPLTFTMHTEGLAVYVAGDT